jgi:hypothetical protein
MAWRARSVGDVVVGSVGLDWTGLDWTGLDWTRIDLFRTFTTSLLLRCGALSLVLDDSFRFATFGLLARIESGIKIKIGMKIGIDIGIDIDTDTDKGIENIHLALSRNRNDSTGDFFGSRVP